MPGALQVVIVYKKDTSLGLTKDANTLAKMLPIAGRSVGCPVAPVKLLDVREPPNVCDLCIHLETPQPVWFSWARANVVVGYSTWRIEEWKGYWDQIDVALFRDSASLARATASGGPRRLGLVTSWFVDGAKPYKELNRSGLVWFLGGSANKRSAAEAVLPLWKEEYPMLNVYTTEKFLDGLEVSSNVKIHVGFLKEDEKDRIATAAAGHICLSKEGGLGYTALEAEAKGAWMMLTPFPCYTETFQQTPNVGWLNTPVKDGVADVSALTPEMLEAALSSFAGFGVREAMNTLDLSLKRKADFSNAVGTLLKEATEAIAANPPLPRHMPPLLNPGDCPPISVITLVYGRPKFIENACLNLLSTDYPHDKIEWVVVDDSPPEDSPSHRIVRFQNQWKGKVTYVPLHKKTSIGQKRNIGVEKAGANILLMMDDDDHYPHTSIRRRVAYLLKGRQQMECAVCTTIAMYDLTTGISAVNVPPYTMSLGQRCSEATLTFTRKFWEQRPFEDSSMAEGEAFLFGRESQVVEMPPQQIIVALTHRTNTSRRAIPEGKPGCFWGFPRELLEFLHGLVGVKVEAA